MSRRKDELRALLAGNETEKSRNGQPASDRGEGGGAAAHPPARPPSASPAPERAASGAVKAMGLALGALRSGAEEAKTLRDTLAKAERVIEIDPAMIEPAFVSDRLSRAGDGDESFETLKASIAAGGQEVPVLVRRHPEENKAAEGFYQAAYGHRRIAATRALGLPVRAVVRALTDEELVLAQGKENSERRDLSFIERALFCRALLERGFERRTVEAALSIHKTEMTRLLQVAEAIPRHIAEAIGPAPRAGRNRWIGLAELLKTAANSVKAQDEITQERFRAATSDERFALLLDRLARGAAPTRRLTRTLTGEGGVTIASLTRAPKAALFEIEAEDFADFIEAELPRLHAAFMAKARAEHET